MNVSRRLLLAPSLGVGVGAAAIASYANPAHAAGAYVTTAALNARTGRINHVSIYLGEGQMMEAAYGFAAVARVRTERLAPNVKRVFA